MERLGFASWNPVMFFFAALPGYLLSHLPYSTNALAKGFRLSPLGPYFQTFNGNSWEHHTSTLGPC